MNKIIICYVVVLIQTASIGVGLWHVGGDLKHRAQAEQESSKEFIGIANKIESGEITLSKEQVVFTINSITTGNELMAKAYISYDEAFSDHLEYILYTVLGQTLILFALL